MNWLCIKSDSMTSCRYQRASGWQAPQEIIYHALTLESREPEQNKKADEVARKKEEKLMKCTCISLLNSSIAFCMSDISHLFKIRPFLSLEPGFDCSFCFSLSSVPCPQPPPPPPPCPHPPAPLP